MRGRVSKSRTRQSGLKPSKLPQGQQLDPVASKGAELPPSNTERSLAGGDLARDSGTLQPRKRQIDAASAKDPLPAKRARLIGTDTQRLGVEDNTAKQADETTLQQPKPKRPYASFLKDFVDPVPPNRTESVHTFVSEWLESVGSDREKRCRSESHLHHSDDDALPRSRSAPEMGYTRDADGFAVPPTPASTGSGSRRPSAADDRSQLSATSASGSSTPSSSVRHRMYRQNNLEFNHIYVQHPAAPLPDVISSHVDDMLRAERDSPELSSDELKQNMYRLDALAAGCDEDDVAAFLNDIIFPNPKTDPTYGPTTGLMSSSSAPMSQHLVPADPASPYRVTQPKPDKLYGYLGSENSAFTRPQLLAQTMLHPRNRDYPAATSQGLRFPFFAIEFKAAGGTRGDLWVATNQCAGASAACLNAVEQLNTTLKHQSVQLVDNLSYCIAVDNNVAQLYISWKEDDLNYFLQRVDAFLLSSPEHFKNFRKQVRNILDWGKDTRLEQIRNALDTILEESRKKAAERAKTRQPPSDGSETSSKKPKSSSRRNSSKPSGVQGEGSGSEPYWTWDETYGRWSHPNADGTTTWAEEGQSSSVAPAE